MKLDDNNDDPAFSSHAMPATKPRPAKPTPDEFTPQPSPLDELLRSSKPPLSVGEAADELGVAPRLLTQWFYLRILPVEGCLMVNGRRRIPAAMLPEIRQILIDRGHLPPGE